MEQLEIALSPKRSTDQFIDDINQLTEEIQQLYTLDSIPWIVGYSGGKDSSSVLQLIWNAIAYLPIEKRHKKVYAITTDTLVENPFISTWIKNSLKQMKNAAKEQNIPIEVHLLYPEIKDTYWVNLIGKGYPSPRPRFRWCTERLKISPSNRFVRNVVRANGEVILVLGTRKAESIRRAVSMEKHEVGRVSDRLHNKTDSLKSLLYESPSLPNSLIYSPIQDWRTDEVWMYLMQWQNPWGQDNKKLFNLYRGATADNECPLVLDSSTPSCGDSRFGCWVCTMVNKDKSMEAMILNDEQKEWMQPLLDIRNDLDEENDRYRRDFRRIFGTVQLFERNVDGEISVEPIPGPYTKKWREHWLRRVLEAQVQIRQTAPEEYRDITLIQLEELSEIRRIWLEEKHEFDDSLPRIYEEVTGEPFKDPRRGAGNAYLGSDEWGILQDICDEDEMHFELMSRLLDTERQYKSKARRTGIYEDIEKCFDTSSRSKDEAVENAHLKRDLKTAVEEANVDKVKQLTWAGVKYGTSNSTDNEEE